MPTPCLMCTRVIAFLYSLELDEAYPPALRAVTNYLRRCSGLPLFLPCRILSVFPSTTVSLGITDGRSFPPASYRLLSDAHVKWTPGKNRWCEWVRGSFRDRLLLELTLELPSHPVLFQMWSEMQTLKSHQRKIQDPVRN